MPWIWDRPSEVIRSSALILRMGELEAQGSCRPHQDTHRTCGRVSPRTDVARFQERAPSQGPGSAQSVRTVFPEAGPRADGAMQRPQVQSLLWRSLRSPPGAAARRRAGCAGAAARKLSRHQGGSPGRSQPDEGAWPSREASAAVVMTRNRSE